MKYDKVGADEDSECDSDDAADGIDSDSDSSSVANYLENQLDNYIPDAVDEMISATESLDMDTVEGIKVYWNLKTPPESGKR